MMNHRAHHPVRLLIGCLLIGLLAQPARAHNGEDHSEPAAEPRPVQPQAAGRPEAPQRLPDGSQWIPKAAQHQLGLRTVRAITQDIPLAIELNGKVLAAPNAGGRVQAAQTGRIEAPPQGLPELGQRVSKGQVLAYLRPASSSTERGNQQATLAELDAQYTVAERKLQRYAQLEGAIARKDIDAARIERDALQQRRDAVRRSLTAPEALQAPISGIIASSNATLGEVVEARDVLFDIVDPSRLMVEALAYDAAIVPDLADASAKVPGGAITLRFAGAGIQLREQAMPVRFHVTQASAPLALGQALQITVRRKQAARGMAVPRLAIQRNASGADMVWVHTQPERFVPRAVTTRPLSDSAVVVTQGLHEGDRVVTDGASLLAQMR